LWGVVNNAGFELAGQVEFLTMDQYDKLAQVNLWGTVRVTKAFLPLVRRAKGITAIWVTKAFLPLVRRGKGITAIWVIKAFLSLVRQAKGITAIWVTKAFLPHDRQAKGIK
jgi:NAD(P)-dependent dehydrogenase (short-subunit alcohol dehydrogenase family)